MARWFVDRLPQRGIPSVSLRRLLPGARFVGTPDLEVSGCTDDHRRLEPGQVFVAVSEPRYDGHAHVREAIERGAAGVVVERPCDEAGRLQVVVADARSAHARICQALAGDPCRRLTTVGVTGTFGKSVASLLLRSVLEAAGHRCGLVGGLGWSDGMTTRPLGAGLAGRDPEGRWPGGAAGLATILSTMVDRDCSAGVIEVGAPALEARSLEGVELRAAVVTDVGGPLGLDSESARRNRRAKARLFRHLAPGGAAVVNADDPDAEILGAVNLDARRVSFGLADPSSVDVSAQVERADTSGTTFRLLGFGRAETVRLRLLGPRQVAHALAAAAAAWALGIGAGPVVEGLEKVAGVAGQLEAVDEGQDFHVRVDEAQTAPLLRQAIGVLRGLGAGRLVLVLSGEGGQSRDDRHALAAIAEREADRVVLTLGNARSEDPGQILEEILGGFRRPGKVAVRPDRRAAIEEALALASPGDTVLIAGKGRNAYQIFSDRIVPFDDFAVARTALRGLHPAQRTA